MNTAVAALLALAAAITVVQAQAPPLPNPPPEPPSPPPPVYPAATAVRSPAPVYVYDQKPITTSGGRTYLISPDQAQGIITRFKEAYSKMGNPRFVIYVNRELIDENSGLKLSSHKQVVETARTAGSETAANATNSAARDRALSTNIYRLQEPKQVPLPDRQTMRDVERLFGRPMRMAGVQLADQTVATQLLSSKALDPYVSQPDSELARRSREALSKIADVVLEILISSKDTTVSGLEGDQTYPAPDIQATAVRLSDAKILGQATAADIIGQGPAAGKALRTFGMREIAEATALSLMEDMMLQ